MLFYNLNYFHSKSSVMYKEAISNRSSSNVMRNNIHGSSSSNVLRNNLHVSSSSNVLRNNPSAVSIHDDVTMSNLIEEEETGSPLQNLGSEPQITPPVAPPQPPRSNKLAKLTGNGDIMKKKRSKY